MIQKNFFALFYYFKGENIPPVHIENLVKGECSAISNAFLVGDKRKFLTILITLKTEMDSEGTPKDELTGDSLKLMESLDLKYTKMSEILENGPDPKVMAVIQEAIYRANKRLLDILNTMTCIFIFFFSILRTVQSQTLKKFKNSHSLNMTSRLQRENWDQQ